MTMRINKVLIKNFKGFYGSFEIKLTEGLNVIVGDNEVGKSTILSAIQLVISGIYEGKSFMQQVNEYLINMAAVKNYVDCVNSKNYIDPPHLFVEIYLDKSAYPESKGTNNSLREDSCGLKFVYELNQNLKNDYEKFIKSGNISTIPIEYYTFSWSTFSGISILPRTIPLKTAMIDSSSHKSSNGSDIHVNRIVRDFLTSNEKIELTQAHRKMKDDFMSEEIVKSVNYNIAATSKISDKNVELAVDVSGRNSWENSMTTFLDGIPFNFVGKGEQCLVKTKLALEHRDVTLASIVLIEEPENHLSHSKLNKLINHISTSAAGKQIIISTHSSYVANKLGLQDLILLKNKKSFPISDLDDATNSFFKKLPGYNTLRLILCKKAILVEGDSDELIVQRAYFDKYGKLPIENEIDVISVGMSFLRFLKIAEKLNVDTVVIGDSDGDLLAIDKKFDKYIGKNKKSNILISIDRNIDSGNIADLNYNTLEPKIVKENDLKTMNTILDTKYKKIDDLHIHMKNNKTASALKIFEHEDSINYPAYITNAFA